jgi:hypothetical protein
VTALICASANGHVEVVKLLLASPGIDCNHEDNEVCGCVSEWGITLCLILSLLCMCLKFVVCVYPFTIVSGL